MSDTTFNPTADWDTIHPSELVNDIRRLSTEDVSVVTADLNRKYRSALPLLLVSLFTDLLTHSGMDESFVNEWLDRAPEGPGQVIADAIRTLLTTDDSPEAEVAALQKAEAAFMALSPLDYILGIVALVRIFAQPRVQEYLASLDHSDLDGQFDDFFDTEDGQAFKDAVEALVGPTEQSA